MTPDDINKADSDGNTLLHAAAAKGDMALVEQYLGQGAKALVYNNENECPRDVARAWGYDDVAKRLDAAMTAERLSAPVQSIPYASLAEIREQGAFHVLAARGMFDGVIALAEKDPAGLTAQDLLSTGEDGESVILKLCQQGQLALLLKRELWMNNLADFNRIWTAVPEIYKQGHDIQDFVGKARQTKLQPRISKPLRKSPRKD